MARAEVCLSMVILLAITTVIVILTGFANFAIAQGQANSSASSLSLTPKQRVDASPITTITANKSSSLYEQGYAKGVEDGKLVQSNFRASTIMSSKQVDCDSSINPQMVNEEYCSGYQHGFADTNNNEVLGKQPTSHSRR
jgi:hypothetical protein